MEARTHLLHPHRRSLALLAVVAVAAPLPGLPAASAVDRGPWVPPLRQSVEVLRGFDPPEQRWLAGHRGVDLAADVGAEVRAADDGVVVYAAPLAGRGVVSIDHGGIRSTYEPVTATVSAGEQVSQGQLIGHLEEPAEGKGEGHCDESCLHWGARVGDDYVDPLALLDLGPPILLPVGAPVARGAAGSLSLPWHRLQPGALPRTPVVPARPVIQALRSASRLL